MSVRRTPDEPCVCDSEFSCLADEHDKGRCDACETSGIYLLCCGEHQARMCSGCHDLNHGRAAPPRPREREPRDERRARMRHVRTDPACSQHRRPRGRLSTWWFDRHRGRMCPPCGAERLAAYSKADR